MVRRDNSQVQGGAASKLKKKRLRAEAAAFLVLDQCARVRGGEGILGRTSEILAMWYLSTLGDVSVSPSHLLAHQCESTAFESRAQTQQWTASRLVARADQISRKTTCQHALRVPQDKLRPATGSTNARVPYGYQVLAPQHIGILVWRAVLPRTGATSTPP